MNTLFNRKFTLVTHTGVHSPLIKGIMRKDETAAILSPEYKPQLEDACKLCYFRSAHDVREYEIYEYYCDIQRPLGNFLSKPIVVRLSKSVDHQNR